MTAVHAYILVQTEVGKSQEVAMAIAELPGVHDSSDVTGPYDVIARVSAADMDVLGKEIIKPIFTIPGITRTLTCPVVASY